MGIAPAVVNVVDSVYLPEQAQALEDAALHEAILADLVGGALLQAEVHEAHEVYVEVVDVMVSQHVVGSAGCVGQVSLEAQAEALVEAPMACEEALVARVQGQREAGAVEMQLLSAALHEEARLLLARLLPALGYQRYMAGLAPHAAVFLREGQGTLPNQLRLVGESKQLDGAAAQVGGHGGRRR